MKHTSTGRSPTSPFAAKMPTVAPQVCSAKIECHMLLICVNARGAARLHLFSDLYRTYV